MSKDNKDNSVNIDYGYGREVIYTDETEITDENICKVVKETFELHMKNSQAQESLFAYEKGKQPILDRVKDIRPEINHKLVDNEASKIVDFKLGYEFGNPINLVQRAKVEPCKNGEDKISDDDMKIALLNEMFVEENKESKDNKCARDFLISGLGYKMALAKKNVNGVAVFDYVIPNPLTTYIVRTNDVYRKKVLGVTYSINKVTGYVTLGAYTENKYYLFKGTFDEYTYEEINGIGKIPIVEYAYNHDRMGCFEKVIPLINYKNIVGSDRLNDISQHVQSLLWMNDCELEDDDKEKVSNEGGLVITRTTPDGKTPNIEYLSQVLNQSEIQTFADYLKDQIMEQSGVPTKGENGGGSTGSALSLSNGWATAEQLAKITESIYKESEMEFIDLVLTIIKNSNDVKNKEIKKLELSDIGIKFARNKTYDLGTKVNALATLLNSGVDGLKAFEVIDLFPDTQQAWLDSRENIEKKQGVSKEDNSEIEENATINNNERIMGDSSDNYEQSPIAKL